MFGGGSTHHPFFGLDVPDGLVTDAETVTSQTGYQPAVFNVFVKLDSPKFGVGQLEAIAAAGMTPMVTLEPWSTDSHRGQPDLSVYRLKTFVAGDHNQSLDRLAGILASYGQPVYLRFAHEMNGSWYPWAETQNGNTPGDYVRVWRHVHARFTTDKATNVRWLWSPNALLGPQTAATYRELYPGNAWVDDVGLTAYGQGPSASATIDRSLRALTAVSDKEVILSETGAGGIDKTAWIRSFGIYLSRHKRIAGFVWYNTTPETTGATGDYRFNDNPADIAEFRSTLKKAGVLEAPSRSH